MQRYHFKRNILYNLILTIVVIILITSIVYRPWMQFNTNVFHGIHRVQEDLESFFKAFECEVIPNLGHLGESGHLQGEDKQLGDEIYKKIELNSLLSDRIPLIRTLKDPRHPNCKRIEYEPRISASVVIVYYDEIFSVMLRTIWSVITQSPTSLLKEIVLVDDASTNKTLTPLVRYYVQSRIGNRAQIKLVTLATRGGLIRARLVGAKIATGDVLIFLDAHCEATTGWMEPLLSRIEKDRTIVTLPIVDRINGKDFRYVKEFHLNDNDFMVYGFYWSGEFAWIAIQNQSYDIDSVEPVPSPTMPGGLLAIERKYFWEVGSYDEQMFNWGGENIEMSFRIWQCGGRIEVVPCSRVAHLYRAYHTYSLSSTESINLARAAYVWMDDYKRLLLDYYPNLKTNFTGNLAERHQLRQNLKCHDFEWYLRNVYPEKFVPDENTIAYGQIRTKKSWCLDNYAPEHFYVGYLGTFNCYNSIVSSQYFSLMVNGEFRTENHCILVSSQKKRVVKLVPCKVKKRFNLWMYFPKNGTIYNLSMKMCLSVKRLNSGKGVFVEPCNTSGDQRFKFANFNRTNWSKAKMLLKKTRKESNQKRV